MTLPDPSTFSQAWAEAWNARDLDRVLHHFHDDVTFSSPVAVQVVPGSHGVLHGKNELRAYWTLGLKLVPDLHFTIQNVFTGIDIMVINYLNQKGNLVNEVLRFEDGLVVEGHGTYLAADPNPAGIARTPTR
jgi:hypothetical protein